MGWPFLHHFLTTQCRCGPRRRYESRTSKTCRSRTKISSVECKPILTKLDEYRKMLLPISTRNGWISTCGENHGESKGPNLLDATRCHPLPPVATRCIHIPLPATSWLGDLSVSAFPNRDWPRPGRKPYANVGMWWHSLSGRNNME